METGVEERALAERKALEERIEACVNKNQYQAAADLQKQLESLPKAGLHGAGQSGMASGSQEAHVRATGLEQRDLAPGRRSTTDVGQHGAGRDGTRVPTAREVTTIAELHEPRTALRSIVSLQSVRLLSIGKTTLLPGKGKSKGKGKGKGRGMAKGSNEEVCMPVYFGQDGHVVCTMAYGQGLVDRVPRDMALGSLVNAIKLQPRPGQLGVLRWTDETRITLCLEPVHTDGPYVFPYDTT